MKCPTCGHIFHETLTPQGPGGCAPWRDMLAWSDSLGNSEPVYAFELSRQHEMYRYTHPERGYEQVAMLQWGYNNETENHGEDPFFYVCCFDLDENEQIEFATDVEMVGAVWLMLRTFPSGEITPESHPHGNGGLSFHDLVDSDEKYWSWEDVDRMCRRYLPRFTKYVEQVARNHSDEYPALRVVMDEIEKPEVPTPTGINYIVHEIIEDDEVDEWTDEEYAEIVDRDLLEVVYAMCEYVLEHKMEVQATA